MRTIEDCINDIKKMKLIMPIDKSFFAGSKEDLKNIFALLDEILEISKADESVKGDLISRSLLIKKLNTFCGNQRYLIPEQVWEIIENQPTVYNDGWIPCSERLPDKSAKYLVTQDRYSIYDRNHKGAKHREVDYVDFNVMDKSWARAKIFEVIAWKPLPAPYQPKGE